MKTIETFILEFPELEGKINHKKFSFFKIYGVNSEKPIVRMNNCIYEGRWLLSEKFPFFFFKNLIQNPKI